MTKLMRPWSALLLLFPLLAAAAAPDIALQDLDGRTRNVNEFIGRGKWVVVAIWAHDCPICNAEMPNMTFFHAEHEKKDALVLGVTIDGHAQRRKAADFIQRHELNFPNLIAEPDPRVIEKFGGGRFFGTPTFYIYAPTGELVARQIGPIEIAELEGLIKNQGKGGAGK